MSPSPPFPSLCLKSTETLDHLFLHSSLLISFAVSVWFFLMDIFVVNRSLQMIGQWKSSHFVIGPNMLNFVELSGFFWQYNNCWVGIEPPTSRKEGHANQHELSSLLRNCGGFIMAQLVGKKPKSFKISLFCFCFCFFLEMYS